MTTLLTLLLCMLALEAPADTPAAAINIGGRRELLVDDFLVERISGEARLCLHQPVPREIVLRTDAPWEGNACGYPSVFQDGPRYRTYYYGGHYRHGGKPAEGRTEHPWVLCYAESDDGIHWRRPELGLCTFDGSTQNNIVVTPESVAAIQGDPAHTAVFLDTNPACPADARYKCVIVGKPHALYLLVSADCPPIFGDDLALVVHWRQGSDVRPLAGQPVRLRLSLRDADLYAFQFVPRGPEGEDGKPTVSNRGGL